MEDYSEQILETVRKADFGLTQRELARETNLSRPTVRKYCKLLLKDGVLTKIEKGNVHLFISAEQGDSDDTR